MKKNSSSNSLVFNYTEYCNEEVGIRKEFDLENNNQNSRLQNIDIGRLNFDTSFKEDPSFVFEEQIMRSNTFFYSDNSSDNEDNLKSQILVPINKETSEVFPQPFFIDSNEIDLNHSICSEISIKDHKSVEFPQINDSEFHIIESFPKIKETQITPQFESSQSFIEKKGKRQIFSPIGRRDQRTSSHVSVEKCISHMAPRGRKSCFSQEDDNELYAQRKMVKEIGK